ncbi:MAG: hypothetical protein COV52_03205 [Gammaproteobacteria bacterium CG11_big_fil_rev_8_21_14_0_20_46_22]|nr:MAG: hypothetical protein COW05_00895 [Gammaproteobacteria bacterium CG12_big_fil_rev_8_21_14_0_65_46_12]PIR11552.1 MAG: hypothetical protein COV52_03205 [Gammaproteobacteria bacterium CG11_big_fil_rev_8_21_14_0_20_46_22]
MPFIKLNNSQFYYELHGQPSNKALVLISGFGADHTYWEPLLTDLVKEYYVLVFDNRAVGQTLDHHHEPLTIEQFADDTVNLFQALELKKPHIVGQSMGGAIALAIAQQYPHKIDRACTMAGPAKWRLNTVAGLRSMHLAYRDSASFDALFQAELGWVYGERFLKNVEKIAALKQLLQSNPYPQSLQNQARQLHAIEAFDLSDKLENIQTNILILGGEEDILCTPADCQFLDKHLPNSTLVMLEKVAHAARLEAPEETFMALFDFFA